MVQLTLFLVRREQQDGGNPSGSGHHFGYPAPLGPLRPARRYLPDASSVSHLRSSHRRDGHLPPQEFYLNSLPVIQASRSGIAYRFGEFGKTFHNFIQQISQIHIRK